MKESPEQQTNEGKKIEKRETKELPERFFADEIEQHAETITSLSGEEFEKKKSKLTTKLETYIVAGLIAMNMAVSVSEVEAVQRAGRVSSEISYRYDQYENMVGRRDWEKYQSEMERLQQDTFKAYEYFNDRIRKAVRENDYKLAEKLQGTMQKAIDEIQKQKEELTEEYQKKTKEQQERQRKIGGAARILSDILIR